MKVKKEKGPKTLEAGEAIHYKDLTPDFGRAEFQFCIVARRGKMVEVHIQRRQQKDTEHEWFVLKVPADCGIAFKHRDNNLAPWRYGACKRHGVGFDIYVPAGTDRLVVRHLSSVQTRFEFIDKGAELTLPPWVKRRTA